MTPIFSFSSSRRFQCWSYSVSHKRLLLRSHKSAEYPTRIDVMFYFVAAMRIDVSPMIGLGVAERAGATDDSWVNAVLARHAARMRAFHITSTNGDGWVVAESASMHEDRGEYWEASAFDHKPHLPREVERGAVYELWSREHSGAPEILIVRNDGASVEARQAYSGGAVLFRAGSHNLVREWLERSGYELVAQRVVPSDQSRA